MPESHKFPLHEEHLWILKFLIHTRRRGNLRDSGIDLLKVEIPKLSTDSGIDQIGCLILELTLLEVRMVLIVGILMLLLYSPQMGQLSVT